MVAFQHISLWKFKEGTEKEARAECLQKLKKVSKPGLLKIVVGEQVANGESEWSVGFTAELQGIATVPVILEELKNVAKDLPLENHTHVAIQCLAAPAIRAPAQQSATSSKRNFRAMGMPFMPAPKTQRPAIPSSTDGDAAKKDENANADEAAKPTDAKKDDSAKPSEWRNRDITKQVYVSELPYRANNEDIWSFFKDKGFNVTRVHIFRTPMGKSKGACVIDLENADEPQKAIDQCNGLEFKIGGDEEHGARKIKVSLSGQNRPERGNAERSSGPSVIVKNLSFAATEANLGELFAGCGEIKDVRIAKDRKSGRSKGFAIVEFTHKGALDKAVKRTGREIKGRAVNIELTKNFGNDSKDKESKPEKSNDAKKDVEQSMFDGLMSGFVKAGEKKEEKEDSAKETTAEGNEAEENVPAVGPSE